MAMITFSLTPASFSATKPGHRGIEGAIGGLNLGQDDGFRQILLRHGHDVGIGQLACRLSFSLRLPALSRDLGSFLNLTHGRQQIPGLFGIGDRLLDDVARPQPGGFEQLQI